MMSGKKRSRRKSGTSSSEEIRNAFLRYFQEKQHTIVPSAPLIPPGDPTLLFTNAGMVQFKGTFLGEERRDYVRAASSQKCLRVSGKHNDLENVGHTARHHTFFEMLGNFSFGDYFKAGAIAYAWEFLVDRMGLPSDALWATVFEEDDEARRLWESEAGLPPDRIVGMGEGDNYWSMGDTGPCGPCSEILIDQGPELSCGRPDCGPACDCGRYLELWNLVFMQFNRDGSGKKTELPRPSIDTGMGLERIAAVLQGKRSNYETDLFTPIIDFVGSLAGKSYGSDPAESVSLRVIADHARAVAFLICDGIHPSNEGRGYVLRRVLRRALRHGRMLGLDRPFLHKTLRVVAGEMAGAYPELGKRLRSIQSYVKKEEERFLQTLDQGLHILQQEIARLREAGAAVFSGDIAFRLYDTYGFPLDLTEDILREENLTVDRNAYEAAMAAQRVRGRESWKAEGGGAEAEVYASMAKKGITTRFLGHEGLTARAKVVRILVKGKEVGEGAEGCDVSVVTDTTPFYGEAGGQVGDRGEIRNGDLRICIEDTKKPHPDLVVHLGRVEKGSVRVGDEVSLEVDRDTRTRTALNHSATHLLHAALRKVLGERVQQQGSLVEPGRLRFDFSHDAPLAREQIRHVEDLVNGVIRSNVAVKKEVRPLREALAMGAMAFFAEKYPERVRVVRMGDSSLELCGGTHVGQTGEIGLFKIVGQESVAAGVRRVVALTGPGAEEYVAREEALIERLASMLKSPREELADRVAKLLEGQKSLQREIETLKKRLTAQAAGDILDEVREVKGVKVLATKVEGVEGKGLLEFADRLRVRLGSGIVLLAGESRGKAQLVLSVTPDLAQRYDAVRLIREIAVHVGGSGGGRPDMARAGGSKASGIPEALQALLRLL